MLTYNREYHYVGELTIHRSHVLDEKCQPKDDIVNWLFLIIEKYQYSFVYQIEDPFNAKYNNSFKIKIAFTAIDEVNKVIQLNHIYEVFRGEEHIGVIKIINCK